MEQPGVFQNALSSFATEVACGGAVRHLTDLGYTLDQIVDRLDYPAPRAKVQRLMMEDLYEKQVLLRENPAEAVFAEKTAFVQEQDAYGRRSFRKINADQNSQNEMTDMPDLTALSQSEKTVQLKDSFWNELTYNPKQNGKLTELLHTKCSRNGEENSYLSCDFTCLNIDQNSQNRQNTKETILACLNGRQREYLLGIRWEAEVTYHRLDQRMREIVGKLYEAGAYHGICYFRKTREMLTL